MEDPHILKKMLSDANNIEQDFIQFNDQYRQFLEADTSLTSVVLRCHLLVEHYLDNYLIACNPSIIEWDKSRLTFYQKLNLADHPNSSIHLLIPPLKNLNTVRNQLVHNLNLKSEDLNIKPINEFVSMWKAAGGYPVPTGNNLIMEFTLTACSWLFGISKSIERHGKGKGLLGLFKWWKKK